MHLYQESPGVMRPWVRVRIGSWVGSRIWIRIRIRPWIRWIGLWIRLGLIDNNGDGLGRRKIAVTANGGDTVLRRAVWINSLGANAGILSSSHTFACNIHPVAVVHLPDDGGALSRNHAVGDAIESSNDWIDRSRLHLDG
jgi:hypothetical protein